MRNLDQKEMIALLFFHGEIDMEDMVDQTHPIIISEPHEEPES